jgi:hypothetical protein
MTINTSVAALQSAVGMSCSWILPVHRRMRPKKQRSLEALHQSLYRYPYLHGGALHNVRMSFHTPFPAFRSLFRLTPGHLGLWLPDLFMVLGTVLGVGVVHCALMHLMHMTSTKIQSSTCATYNFLLGMWNCFR